MRNTIPALLLFAAISASPALAQTVAAPSPEAEVESDEQSYSVLDRGAPRLESESGWSIKPRGRLQLDAAKLDLPAFLPPGATGKSDAEVRRFYLGVEGAIPGGFGYRIEADFAGGEVAMTDAYLTYEPADGLTLTLGQQKTFQGMDDMTSDLFTTMLERAAFTSAFGFERRLGFSGVYETGELTVQVGAFLDDIEALSDPGHDKFSLDARVVYSPKIGNGRLHVGGSAHWRELSDTASNVRYRARPFVHATDLRLVDTGTFGATAERSFGAELAYTTGPFHAIVEGHRKIASRPGLPNASFEGGYAEVGMVITPGDAPSYKDGNFDRLSPSRPVSAGGIGAIQLNARYDHLDLDDGAILGGRQQALGLSAIWAPVNRLRFVLNYGHLWIDGAAVPAGTDRDYTVDTFGIRAQVDF